MLTVHDNWFLYLHTNDEKQKRIVVDRDSVDLMILS